MLPLHIGRFSKLFTLKKNQTTYASRFVIGTASRSTYLVSYSVPSYTHVLSWEWWSASVTIHCVPNYSQVNTVSLSKIPNSNKLMDIPAIRFSSSSGPWSGGGGGVPGGVGLSRGWGNDIARAKEMSKKTRHFIFLQRNGTEISRMLLNKYTDPNAWILLAFCREDMR